MINGQWEPADYAALIGGGAGLGQLIGGGISAAEATPQIKQALNMEKGLIPGYQHMQDEAQMRAGEAAKWAMAGMSPEEKTEALSQIHNQAGESLGNLRNAGLTQASYAANVPHVGATTMNALADLYARDAQRQRENRMYAQGQGEKATDMRSLPLAAEQNYIGALGNQAQAGAARGNALMGAGLQNAISGTIMPYAGYMQRRQDGTLMQPTGNPQQQTATPAGAQPPSDQTPALPPGSAPSFGQPNVTYDYLGNQIIAPNAQPQAAPVDQFGGQTTPNWLGSASPWTQPPNSQFGSPQTGYSQQGQEMAPAYQPPPQPYSLYPSWLR